MTRIRAISASSSTVAILGAVPPPGLARAGARPTSDPHRQGGASSMPVFTGEFVMRLEPVVHKSGLTPVPDQKAMTVGLTPHAARLGADPRSPMLPSCQGPSRVDDPKASRLYQSMHHMPFAWYAPQHASYCPPVPYQN